MPKLKKINKITDRIKDKILEHEKDSYLIINAIFAGIVLAILIYSGIFSASSISHPIKSNTIDSTVSTGLSRAFSEIVRFNFAKALDFNPYSIHIFLFFFIQLFLRFAMSILLLSSSISKNLLLIADILMSVLLFLWSFGSFILAQL